MNSNLTFTDDAVKLVKIVADRSISSTQSIKTLIIEKNGQRFISLQKWWRKSSDEPWLEGKGFHFSAKEARDAVTDLNSAVKLLAEGD